MHSHPLYEKLYDFQKEGVNFLVKNRTALLADEVGVGKTAQALMATAIVGAKSVLIICPASIKYDYPFRAKEWGFDPDQVYVITPQNAREMSQHQSGIFVMNYDICFRKEVARYFAKRRYDVLICDESHYLKSQKSRRSKAAFGAGGYVSLANRIWFLTGTPMLNRPEELYTTLRALCPDRIRGFEDYVQFTVRYCGGHHGHWGWVADGATNTAELAKKLEGFMLRRERDVLPELPEKIMRVVHIEKTREIEKLLFEEREDQESMSIRQRMGLAKISEVIQYVSEQLETEKKIVIFAYHKAVIDKLYEAFAEYGVVAVTGDDSAKLKHEKVKSFINTPEIRTFIGQVDAVGTGVDGLQGVCNIAVFAEISYVPGINQQAMGRLHRNGQKHKTIFDFLIVSGSIDENILDQNVFKSGVIKTIMQDENTIFDFTKRDTNEREEVMEGKKMKINITFEMPFNSELIEKIVSGVSGQEGVENVECSISFKALFAPAAVTPEVLPPAAPKAPRKTRATTPAAVPTAAPAPAPSVFDTVSAGTPAPAAPAPAAVVTAAPAPAPRTPVSYEQTVRDTASLIQAKVGAKDPLKINTVLGELNAEIKKEFPQYAHVLLIKNPEEQKKVLDIIEKFLEKKGFTNGAAA